VLANQEHCRLVVSHFCTPSPRLSRLENGRHHPKIFVVCLHHFCSPCRCTCAKLRAGGLEACRSDKCSILKLVCLHCPAIKFGVYEHASETMHFKVLVILSSNISSMKTEMAFNFGDLQTRNVELKHALSFNIIPEKRQALRRTRSLGKNLSQHLHATARAPRPGPSQPSNSQAGRRAHPPSPLPRPLARRSSPPAAASPAHRSRRSSYLPVLQSLFISMIFPAGARMRRRRLQGVHPRWCVPLACVAGLGRAGAGGRLRRGRGATGDRGGGRAGGVVAPRRGSPARARAQPVCLQEQPGPAAGRGGADVPRERAR
jgi:hypothetical protein